MALPCPSINPSPSACSEPIRVLQFVKQPNHSLKPRPLVGVFCWESPSHRGSGGSLPNRSGKPPMGLAAGAWPRASPCELQNAAVAVDTVMGMDWVPGARKGKLRGFAAEAPAVGSLVASALPPTQPSGPPQPASLPWPWCSCELGQRQSGRTPAHTAIACFGLQQGIGQGRGRSPLPQLGSGPQLRPGGLHPRESTAFAFREHWSRGQHEWYGFGLRRSKRVYPLELLLAGPLRSRKALMWWDQTS